MRCKDMETLVGCLRHPEGTNTSVVIHYEYRENADGDVQCHGVRVTDALGVIVGVDAGDVLTLGECPLVLQSSFYYARLVGAAGAVAVPVSTFAVTVFNNTPATLLLDFVAGQQSVPPFSSHNLAKDPATDTPFIGPLTFSVLNGAIGLTDEILVNFKAVA